MKNELEPYIINGKNFSKNELEVFCASKISSEKMEDWEKEVYSFIIDWLSSSPNIQVNTSGSTGKPKEIFLEKKYMTASARATLNFFRLQPGNFALLCLPVKFIAGKMMVVRALVGGLNLVFTKPSSLPELDNFKKIDFCAMVPHQVAGLLETTKGTKKIEKIQNLIIGGTFLSKTLESKIKNLKTNVWQTYGMTETITHIALRRISGKGPDDFYSPMKGVQLSLDKHGCLIIHAKKIGVHQLATNDLAEMDTSGKFKILGRNDNVVISGGVKLIPEEIEKKLSGWIENEFYLSSLPDEKLGNKLVLYIEDKGKLKKQIYLLWEKIEAKLSGFEIPKEIIFNNSFTRTEGDKIIRK